MASIVENKNVIGEKTDEDNNNDDSNNNINEIQRQEPREFIDKLQKEEGKLSHEIKEELEKKYPAEKRGRMVRTNALLDARGTTQ